MRTERLKLNPEDEGRGDAGRPAQRVRRQRARQTLPGLAQRERGGRESRRNPIDRLRAIRAR